MSVWQVHYRKYVAERICDDVSRGKHLSGFSVAENKLTNLIYKLESALNEARWYGDICKAEASRYENMQKQVQDCPGDCSEEYAREAFSQSPQELRGYYEKLDKGQSVLREAIEFVKEISAKVRDAKDDAEDASKKVIDTIERAIDLMHNYLKVEF